MRGFIVGALTVRQDIFVARQITYPAASGIMAEYMDQSNSVPLPLLRLLLISVP